MTCYFDPNTGDVYDFDGEIVGNLEETSQAQTWNGDFPPKVLDILREAMDGSKPSAYNQSLLADMASDNIEEGLPPEK